MAQVFDKMRELNGLPYRTPEAKYVVSLWYIPNGTDYHAAESIDVFFVDHASADQYAGFFAMPPEMAGMMDPIVMKSMQCTHMRTTAKMVNLLNTIKEQHGNV